MGPGAGLRGGASGTATHQADASLARELSLHPRGTPAGCDLHPPRERGSQRSGNSAGHVANGRKGETGVPGLPSTQPQGLLGHAAWPGLLSRASRAALKALVTADAYRVPRAGTHHAPVRSNTAARGGVVPAPVLQTMEPRHRRGRWPTSLSCPGADPSGPARPPPLRLENPLEESPGLSA